MARAQINLFICKLRLLQYGLVDELSHLEELRRQGLRKTSLKANGTLEPVSDEETDEEGILKRSEEFVRRCTVKARKRDREKASTLLGDPATLAERKAAIKSFLLQIALVKKCHFCKGISPGFKKDSNLNIFRKALSANQKKHNAQNGLRMTNALIYKQTLERNSAEKRKSLVDGCLNEDVEMPDAGSRSDDDLHGAEGEIANAAAYEDDNDNGGHDDDQKQRFLTGNEVHAALDLLMRREQDVFKLIYNSRPRKHEDSVSADMFFITHILVPANRFRPLLLKDGAVNQTQQNGCLVRIIQATDRVREIQREMQNLIRMILVKHGAIESSSMLLSICRRSSTVSSTKTLGLSGEITKRASNNFLKRSMAFSA